MRQFTLDLRRLTFADPTKCVPVMAGPRHMLPSTERDFIGTALDFGKPFNSDLGGLQDVVEFSKKPPIVTILDPLFTIPPSPTLPPSPAAPAIPFLSISRKKDCTVALGGSYFGGVVAGITGSAGFYGSSTGEFGLFAAGGFALGFASGVSAGSELAFILGAPSDFAGPFLTAALVVEAFPPFISGGGTAIFSPGPVLPSGLVSLIYMGFSVRFSAGISALPFSATIEWTTTVIKPVIRLR